MQTLPGIILSVILGFVIGKLTDFYDRVSDGFPHSKSINLLPALLLAMPLAGLYDMIFR